MDKYVIKKEEIDAMEGVKKQHFLNTNAKRTNKSLGDLTGLNGFGFHLIDVPVGCESTEFHVHYHEEECTYVLSGTGVVIVGEETFDIAEGDFIGYRAGGLPHTMKNKGDEVLRCIVVGQRLNHDVGFYPNKGKKIYRNSGLPWELVDVEHIANPTAGKK